MNDACIIGYGYVGRATAKSFGITKYFDLKGSTINLEDASKCRFVFLCLPTPTVAGVCDTTAIRETIKAIRAFGGDPLFIIRSTVVPGTARSIMEDTGTKRVVSNPEFLSELTWEKDALHPALVVIGADESSELDHLKAIYEGRWRGVQIFQGDTVTAETIKYAFNTFFATKVVFANQLYDACQSLGANYETIRQALEFHPWGSKNHFNVFHKGGRGAGGACLPKDLEAFATISKSPLLQLVREINIKLINDYPKTYERNE